jgi:hypothetical protein
MLERSMAFRWVAGALGLSFEYRDTLEDREWDAFLDSFSERSLPSSEVRLVVYNGGGGPNAAQRASFGQQLRGRPIRIAVLCSSPFPQALTGAFHLMGFPQVIAFKPEHERAAFRHLSLTDAEIVLVHAVAAEFRRGPGLLSVASP